MSAVRWLQARAVALFVCAGSAGCQGETGWSGELPTASVESFQSTVYPVLMRDCAFSECHGAPQRFFQVFGPGRTRLVATSKTDDPPTPEELQVSYARALSMVAVEGAGSIDEARLLRKPLAIDAGGVGHLGVDDFGRNVYPNKLSPGYVALQLWASGAPGVVAGAAAPPVAGGAP